MVSTLPEEEGGAGGCHVPHPCLEPGPQEDTGDPPLPGTGDEARCRRRGLTLLAKRTSSAATWRGRSAREDGKDTTTAWCPAWLSKGIERIFAERVFSQILGFGEYGFPESHAASFALIAYATAYVRHHYPVVFACALLNAWPFGFYSPATVIDDSRRQKVEVPADRHPRQRVRTARWSGRTLPETPLQRLRCVSACAT